MNQIPLKYGVVAGLGIGLVWLSYNFPAFAHDAVPTAAKPQGWSYPFSCGSGMDCREVKAGEKGIVQETERGYVIKTTGEIIPFNDKRIKNSPDGEFHWCSHGGRDTGGTICLFVPPPSW